MRALDRFTRPASLPSGVQEVFGGRDQEKHAVQLKMYPFPFSRLPSLRASFLCLHPFFSLPYPAVSPIHCQEGPCQKGAISVSWQRQRLAAPAASAVSLHFLSGAGEAGQAVPTRAVSLQALERNFHGLGPLPTSFPASHRWGILYLPWKGPAEATDVLGMPHGEEAWWRVAGP